MPIDPNIAMGFKGIELQNPLAQYAQISQIQNAQNQNALAQFQLESARRQDVSQNALSKAWSESVDPTTGKIDYNRLTGLLAAGGAGPQIPAILKQQTEAQAAATAEAQHRAKLAIDKTSMYRDMVNQIETPSHAIKWLQMQVNDPDMAGTPITKRPLMEMASAIPTTPAEFENWKNKQALGMTEFVKQNKPVTFAQDTGSGGRVLSRAGLGGEATVIPGTEFTKTQTFADINAAATLKFNKDKFAWEKANPTLSIQQTPTGYVAVNTTNGMAIPVLYGQDGFQAAGGAQPAIAPSASMMRQPPAALPGQRTPVIPGMASVLDQTAAPSVAPTAAPMALPVGTPGTPVMGKQSELKPIPSNINLAILKNNQSIQQIDETIKLLQQNPSATGVKGYLPGFALNRMDPSGVEARAGVADIGSLVLHDRSGAAVTAAEAPRLVPFIPLPTDDNATVIKKLTRMRNIAAQEQTGLTETYGKDQGYAPNPTVGKTGGAPLSAQQIPPIYATNGKERIMSIDGGQTWTPANK